MIEGGRGVGKSALLAAALERLPAAAIVLRARCTAAEQDYAYGMVEQLFDRAVPRPGLVTGADPADGVDGSAPALLRGYLRVARDLSDTRPVVVAVDDLHLADEASLEWLSFLTRRLAAVSLAVIVTVESGSDVARRLERMAADVETVGTTITLRPEPLCESCVEAVAARLLEGPLDTELAIACHELSRGNPLILREYVNRLRIAGVNPGAPDLGAALTIGATTLADTSLQWLDDRSPAAGELLASLALLGPDAETATAAMLVGQGELEAADSVRSLRGAGLVSSGDPVRIAGPLIAAAALGRISAARRMELHLAAARLLTRLGSTACRAADHLLLVGPAGREWAVDTLRVAAREAVKEARIDTAVRYLRRAAAEGNAVSGTLALELAALELHHDVPSAQRCIDSTLSGFTSLSERADGLAPLANPILLAEGTAAVAPFVDTARALAADRAVPTERYLALGAISVLAGRAVDLPAWVRAVGAPGSAGSLHGPDAYDDSVVADADVRALLAALATLTAANGRGRGRAVRLAQRAARGSVMLGTAAVGATVTASWAEQFDDAALWANWMVDTARSHERRGDLALALVVRAAVTMRIGDPAVAVDDAREAIGLADAIHAAGLRSLAAATAAGGLLELGRVDQATAVLDAAPVPNGAHPIVRASVLLLRGMLARRRGDHRAALKTLQECGYTLAARGLTNPSCLAWRGHVVACHLALGEHDAARDVARDEVALAQRWGAPGAIGRALLTRSTTESGAAAVATAEQAVALLSTTGLHREHARGCRLLADLYAAAGDDARAAEAVAAAADSLQAAGHHGAPVDVRALPLAARGGYSDPGVAGSVATSAVPEETAPPRLTFSEGRVTDLVLQGMTNQEVADALCISRRTVDTHLNRIYRKFAINSRGELADLLRLDH